jgi:hypothetical protein
VAERLGRGLQSLVHRFESGPRLSFPQIATVSEVTLRKVSSTGRMPATTPQDA